MFVMSKSITTYDDSRRLLESNKGIYWVDNALSVHYPEYEYKANKEHSVHIKNGISLQAFSKLHALHLYT